MQGELLSQQKGPLAPADVLVPVSIHDPLPTSGSNQMSFVSIRAPVSRQNDICTENAAGGW
jgi:hypothetical protein